MKSISHITSGLAGTSGCKQVLHQQTALIPEYKNTPTYLGHIPHFLGASILRSLAYPVGVTPPPRNYSEVLIKSSRIPSSVENTS
jgi:hypothetical protein